jgi:hypothetical protein
MAELAAWAAANSAEATAADAIAGGTAADAFCQSIVYGLILSPGGILSLLKLMYSVVFSFAFESSTTEVSGCNKKHLNSAKAKILQWIVEKENKGGIWVAQKEEQTKVQKEEDASSCLSAPALSSRRAAFNNCFDAAAFSEPSASGSAAALGTCVTSQQTLIQYFGRTIGALPSCCFCSRIAPEESTAVRIARSCSCVLLDF